LLSPRENEILTLAASGLTIDQIAARLDIKSATVKTHFDHAKEKLGVANRSQAVAEFTNR
jgi:DNA-binding CsgD family transcriptional regulator